MGEIRTLTEEHFEGTAILYLRVARGQNRPPGNDLPRYISELHFSNPWASPELPSLVYLEKAKVVAAIGVVPRAMDFRNKPIVVATTSLCMVDPEHRKGPAALELLGRILRGPQDLTWTDGASDGPVYAVWPQLGGHTASLYGFNWIRVLRPFGTARIGLERIGNPGRLLHPVSGLVTAPLDFLISKVPLGIVRPPVSLYSSKSVSAEEVFECIGEIGWREALKPAYSLPSFSWLMRQAARCKLGNLRMITVANPEGSRCGWVIYYVSPGASWVLQVGVRSPADFKNTLRALFRDAWEQGSACVKGASIPQYLTALTEEHCFFRHPHDRVLIHSRRPEILDALRVGEAAITRLEGISWMRFSRENWD